jgi:hypothetical protein
MSKVLSVRFEVQVAAIGVDGAENFEHVRKEWTLSRTVETAEQAVQHATSLRGRGLWPSEIRIIKVTRERINAYNAAGK